MKLGTLILGNVKNSREIRFPILGFLKVPKCREFENPIQKSIVS